MRKTTHAGTRGGPVVGYIPESPSLGCVGELRQDVRREQQSASAEGVVDDAQRDGHGNLNRQPRTRRRLRQVRRQRVAGHASHRLSRQRRRRHRPSLRLLDDGRHRFSGPSDRQREHHDRLRGCWGRSGRQFLGRWDQCSAMNPPSSWVSRVGPHFGGCRGLHRRRAPLDVAPSGSATESRSAVARLGRKR